MTVEEKIKQLTDANKELKRLVSEQNLRIQDWIAEMRRVQEYGKMEYERGIAYAWEGARKVIKLKVSERLALFDGMTYETIMEKDPSEVIQKLKEFEANGKEKEEETFKVGDVIKQVSTSGKETGLVCVVRSYENGVMRGISTEGKNVVCSAYTERYWRKTGIHFSNIFIIHKPTEEEPE